MNDDFTPAFPGADSPAAPPREDHTLGASTIFKLCDEVIRLREMNNRKHQDFDRTLVKLRDELKSGFDSFAKDTMRAYQDLRKETVGEKKFSMDLLMLLLEICQDLQHIMEQKPKPEDAEAVKGWMEAVAVETRKVEDAVKQKNILEFERGPASRTIPPCTSASAASASRAWGRSSSLAPSRRATPASSPISSCNGPR